MEYCARASCRASTRSACRGYHIREAGRDRRRRRSASPIAGALCYLELAVRARHRPRHARAPRVVLLGRPQRLLRGDRQAARGASAVGAADPRAARLQGPAVVADARALPDRRRVADRPAAAQQHRPHRDPGAGRGARRHAVAAHQLASTRRFAIPSEEAIKVAVRTQQILLRGDAASPTSSIRSRGSYYVESLTTRIEERGARPHRAHRRDGRHGRGDQHRLRQPDHRRLVVGAAGQKIESDERDRSSA